MSELSEKTQNQIIRKITNIITKNGIPFYIKKWQKYKILPTKSKEDFAQELMKYVNSYHKHTILLYKGRMPALGKHVSKSARKDPSIHFNKDKIGKISFYTFSPEFGEDWQETVESEKDAERHIRKIQTALNKWGKEGLRGLILDFRKHSGGSVAIVIESLRDLLEGSTLYGWTQTIKTKNDKIWVTIKNGEPVNNQRLTTTHLNWDIPIAVIISPKTISAGEFGALIFVGRKNTRIFGSPSAGLLSANEIFTVDKDYDLVLTNSIVETVDFKLHTEEQITPDVITNSPLTTASNWIRSFHN